MKEKFKFGCFFGDSTRELHLFKRDRTMIYSENFPASVTFYEDVEIERLPGGSVYHIEGTQRFLKVFSHSFNGWFDISSKSVKELADFELPRLAREERKLFWRSLFRMKNSTVTDWFLKRTDADGRWGSIVAFTKKTLPISKTFINIKIILNYEKEA
jgi:hypothetical protein